MKKIMRVSVAFVALVALHACSLESVPDPNFLSVGSVSKNANKIQLNSLVYGQFSVARNGLATYLQVVGTIGKELFNFNSTESRWMTELNGLRPIDNSAFYNGATTSFGLPVRQANIILSSVDNTTLVTDVEKNAYRGVANTFKGLAYLYMLNAQYQNGVRLNVEDPFKPSKPATYAASLTGIAGFLDAGATQLDGAGSTFPFAVPTGFASFNTPAEFKKFNRAIALRVAIYQKDWAKAATLLPLTFYNEVGSLTAGPLHTFNPASPDVANPLLNTSSVTVVGLDNVFDAIESGDARLAKVTTTGGPFVYTSGTNVSSKYKSVVYTSATQSVAIIRNEELILIAAEIAAQQAVPNLTEAKRLVDIIRVANGLAVAAAFTTKDEAIDAILKERLYSLWYEGHRWVDMRRYDKLSLIGLPVTTPVMKVLTQLERPVQEVNWDAANP
jgi:starch-binding outer membrane protein, SusD/RagB family